MRSTPPIGTMQHLSRLLFTLLLLSFAPHDATTQIQVRVWFAEKEFRANDVVPGSEAWDLASSHLSERAIDRRGRVLPPEDVVSARDLPVRSADLAAVRQLGIPILQTSRWLNTALVLADSVQVAEIEALDNVDSVQVLGRYDGTSGKATRREKQLVSASAGLVERRSEGASCLSERYGPTERQLRQIGLPDLHRLGFIGEGAFIGVIDAGFDTDVPGLRESRIVARRDFVENDTVVSDPDGIVAQESHGTLVLSVIAGAGISTNGIVGVAPSATFALAKTEDVSSETPLEEDNFVAALEWLEALGVDITNTSLGYTTFDPPYFPHGDHDLDGKTAFASRGLNEASRLGVISIVSAGNDFRTFRRVGVPGEAESAIAVGALDTSGVVAPFSSQGTGDPDRVKPDIAAPGVAIVGIDASRPEVLRSVQGTSLAAPLVTGVAALLRGADPTATPEKIRSALLAGGEKRMPDTLVGRGPIDARRCIDSLAGGGILVGRPSIVQSTTVSLPSLLRTGVWARRNRDPVAFASENRITAELILPGRTVVASASPLLPGLVLHTLDGVVADDLFGLSRIPVSFSTGAGLPARRTLELDAPTVDGVPVLCEPMLFEGSSSVSVWPSPLVGSSVTVSLLLVDEATVTLSMHDTRGAEVMRAIDRAPFPSGQHESRIDLSELATGAYYYRLVIGETVYSRPFVRF